MKMSAFSDWKVGAMTDEEFDAWGVRYNNQERYYEKHMDDEPMDDAEEVD